MQFLLTRFHPYTYRFKLWRYYFELVEKSSNLTLMYVSLILKWGVLARFCTFRLPVANFGSRGWGYFCVDAFFVFIFSQLDTVPQEVLKLANDTSLQLRKACQHQLESGECDHEHDVCIYKRLTFAEMLASYCTCLFRFARLSNFVSFHTNH